MDWATLMYKSIPGLISNCRIIEYPCNVNCNKHPKLGRAHLIIVDRKLTNAFKKKWQFAGSYKIKGQNKVGMISDRCNKKLLILTLWPWSWTFKI
jgi:hypothetical protein